jgi:Protein of unknown function (DUF3563)
MRITAPLYEGDSLLRYGVPAGGADEAPAQNAADLLRRDKSEDTTGLDAWKIEQRARSLRAEYVWSLMAALADRIDGWFAKARRREQEAYLSKASDHVDLERRIRALERSGSLG